MPGFSAHRSDPSSPRPGIWLGRSHPDAAERDGVDHQALELPASVQAACDVIEAFLAGQVSVTRRARLRAELEALGPEPGGGGR